MGYVVVNVFVYWDFDGLVFVVVWMFYVYGVDGGV